MIRNSDKAYCGNEYIYINLTDLGLNSVNFYLNVLFGRNESIFFNKKDTTDKNTIPTVLDIIYDIFCTAKNGEYSGRWCVSDNIIYAPLKLLEGRDYFFTELGKKRHEELVKFRKTITRSVDLYKVGEEDE